MFQLLTQVVDWLFPVYIVGVVFALLWWLSDGFEQFRNPENGSDSEDWLEIHPGVNPNTGRRGLIIVSHGTGMPMGYTG